MTEGIIIFLVILLLPVTLTAVHYFRRTREMTQALDRANERRREITNFLSRFSTGLQEEDGVEGAMHAAARHVAEQTDAESVAIYEVIGNELRVSGVCGTYPLIHSSNQLLFSRHHHLFEALRREEVPIGKGFIGGMATTRQAELVPDASADPRFVEYPDFANFGSVMTEPRMANSIRQLADQAFARSAGAPLSNGNHVNLVGALKVTTYLGAYLHSNTKLPDHRGDMAYADWDAKYQLYLGNKKKLGL